MPDSNQCLRPVLVAAALSAMLVAVAAGAWAVQAAPRIWDIPLGTHVKELPVAEFVDPACGTNGGPAGQFVGGFENFEKCAPEPSGLREIWFIYDDELEYVARAMAPSVWFLDPAAPAVIAEDRVAQQYRATQVMLHPVILSFLIDPAGRVQGYRIFTDPRSDPDLRLGASTVAITFKGRFGMDGWDCADLPPATGEKPIGSPPHERFVKERCEKISEGRKIGIESRFFYRAGQGYLDPFTGRVMENEFVSASSLEVYRMDAVRQ